MASILEKIVHHKRQEVAVQKERVPTAVLEQSLYFGNRVISLRRYLTHPERSGVIAEFKRKSPSKGDINIHSRVEEVTTGYNLAGASGLSILTDEHFFNGSTTDLLAARRMNYLPILRKEFIIDEYQIYEAKSIGADVILLIAECLTKDEVKLLAKCAKSLGLEVLMEVHSEIQLEKCCEYLDLVGVNNRNLNTFEVDIQTSVRLFDKIPNEFVKISESGISDPESVKYLRDVGFKGFLVGEQFMKTANPAQECASFIQKIKP